MTSKKRNSYTTELKQLAVEFAEKHNNRFAAREFDVNESMVRRWKKDKVAMAKLPSEKRARRGGKAHWPQLEEDLKEFVLSKTGRGLSTSIIRARAKEMAKDRGITNFIGGITWYDRFMRRHGLATRQGATVGQHLPEDWGALLADFKVVVEGNITRLGLTTERIVSMDEVAVTFDAPMTQTVSARGTSTNTENGTATVAEKEPSTVAKNKLPTVTIMTMGQIKMQFTVVLACTASGMKLKPLVIFKRLILPNEDLPPGVAVVCNKKGWMNADVIKEWAHDCYSGRPGALSKETSMLVLDSTTANKYDRIRETFKTRHDTVLAVIPWGMTEILQPLDKVVNRIFKLHIHRAWEEWMAECLQDYSMTGTAMRRATHAQVCGWVIDAWEAIKPSTIINAFVKAGIVEDTVPAVEVTVPDEATVPGAQDTVSELEESKTKLQADLAALFHSDKKKSTKASSRRQLLTQ